MLRVLSADAFGKDDMCIYIYVYICSHTLSGGQYVRALQFEKLFQLLIFVRYEMSWAFIELGVWLEERS